MSSELEYPSAFQQKLAEYYDGKLEPYCHQADRIRNMAARIFLDRYLCHIEAGNSKFWEVGEYRTQLNDQDVIYSLAIGKEGRRGKDIRNIGQKVISLILNHQVSYPAALILPKDEIRTSASVVVGDEVNNPEHLQEIENIIRRI